MVAFYLFQVVANWLRLVKFQVSTWRRWALAVPLLWILAPLLLITGIVLLPIEWLAFHVPAWLMPRIRPVGSEKMATSTFADQWKPFVLWILALIVPAYLLAFVVPLPAPLNVLPLVLSLTAFFLVAGINYRKAALGVWYRPVATTDTGHVTTATFVPNVGPTTPAKQVRERLQRYPFLHGLSYLSAAVVLIIFVPLFAGLHLAFGFYPDGAGRPLGDWVLFTLDSSSKALLDVAEVFELDFSPIHAGDSFGEHLAILLKRIVTDLLVIQVVVTLVLWRRDDVGEEAAALAAEAWEGNNEALAKLSGLGDDGVEAFAAHANEVGKSVRSWCEIADHRSLICDAAIGAWLHEGVTDVTELEFGRTARLRWGSLITDRGLKYIGGFTKLIRLELHSCRQISAAGIAYLDGLQALVSLDLSECSQLSGEALEPLKALRRLKQLTLNGCDGLVDGLHHLRGLGLIELNMVEIETLTPAALAPLGGLRLLQALNLRRCRKLRDAGLEHLKPLVNLLTLNLSDCDALTDAGIEHLAALKNLRQLNLGGCGKITDAGAKRLATLTTLTDLIWPGATGLTEDGIATLASMTALRSLNLSGCPALTDSGVAKLTTLSGLTVLDLSKARLLSDAGIAHLAGLPNLHTVNLYDCDALTDAALDTLATLPGLKVLDISSCDQLTAGAKDRFAAARPDCALKR